ncbi:uncharacterized protein LOC144694412 [Cetorhinus maximus]
MGNESSSMGDQDTSKLHKKKKGPLSGSRSSKYGKNDQNVNEELPDLKSTGTASDQAHTSRAHPAPSLRGDKSAVPAAQSLSENIPADLQVKQSDSIQTTVGPVVSGPKTGDNGVQSLESNTESNLVSTSQEQKVGQNDTSPEYKEKANLQIPTDPKAPLLTDNKNSLWSLLEDAVFEGDALKVNNETKTSGAADTGHCLKASSLPVQANTAASVAEERFSDLLHHGEQLDKTDEQGSYPLPQGTVGRVQLPAQETKCSLVLSEPGCKESITGENPAKSTDGQSNLFMVEIQDPRYLTPVGLDERTECAAIAGHNAVSHPQLKVENEQLTEEVVTAKEEKCISPKVSLKGTEGSASMSEYALDSALEGNELSLSYDIDHHQALNSEENECSFLTGTENQRSPANMELLSTRSSDLDPAKLTVTLLAVSDEQQKTHTADPESISTESVCNLVTKTENIPETVVPSSIQQNSSLEGTKEKLMDLSCESEQSQIYNQESKTNACEGDLDSHELLMKNIVSPINPEKIDELELKGTGLNFSREQQITTSESKETACEENAWNLQEPTKSAPSYQNTHSESALNESLGCCCDSNQQTRGSEKQAKVLEEKLSTVQIDRETCSLPETAELPLCQGLDLVQVKEMLLGFQNDQQARSAENQDGRSEKNGLSLQTGRENGLLPDRLVLPSSSKDPDSMGVKGEQLNLNSAGKQQEDTSEIQTEVCEKGLSEEGLPCLQKDSGIENMMLLDTLGLTPSSEPPHTVSVNETLVLSTEHHQAGSNKAKENVCKGNMYSLHTVHAELPLSSQVPDTFISKEALLFAVDEQQAHDSKKKEKTPEENQCDLQTRLESSIFPESGELLLNRQNSFSSVASFESLSDFSRFTAQTSPCTAETLCQEDLSNNQMIKNIIIPAAMQLPAGSDFPSTAEVKESFLSVSSEQTCRSEKQEKVSEENMCSPPSTMESTSFSETVDLPLAPQNIDSTGTENEQECLSHGSVHQTAEGEIEESPIKGEVCSSPTDRQDMISERVESLPTPQCTAGTEMKEALLTFSGEQSPTFIGEEQQKRYEGDVGSLQEGPEDPVLSTSTALALNPQYVTTGETMSEGFAHEQQQLCDSEFKEGLYKKDSDSPQAPVRNIRIPEAFKLPLNMQNPVEHEELLLMGFSNEQQQAGSEIAKRKDCEENVQNLQTDTVKIIATSTDLSPISEIPSNDGRTETLFSHREKQTCDRKQQETVSEDNIYNFPIDTGTSLFYRTKESFPSTQNIGSIASGNEQLPLSCDSEQEAAVGEIAESLSKKIADSFQTDQEEVVSERVEILPTSTDTTGIGMKGALLNFSGEQQQTYSSEEQQKDYEGTLCSLQEILEDTVWSKNTELALNPQDSAMKEKTSEDFDEQLHICDTEFKLGFLKLNLDMSPTPVENTLPPEAIKLSIDVQNPEVVEPSNMLLGLSRQREDCEMKEQVFEANEQNPQTGNISTPEVQKSVESCQNPDATKLEGTIIGFSSEHQQADDNRKQEVTEEKLCCFHIAMENILTPKALQDPGTSGMNEMLLGFIDGKQQQISTRGVEDNYFGESVVCLQQGKENIPQPTTTEYTALYPNPEVSKEGLNYNCDVECQQINGNAMKVDISAESMSSLQVGMKTILPESIASTQSPPTPQALEDNEMPLAFSDEQQCIYRSPKEEKLSENNVCSLMTVAENVTALNNCIELSAGLENHHIKGAGKNPLWLSCENDEQKASSDGLKENVCVESVHGFQLDTENVLPEGLSPSIVTHGQTEGQEALPSFIHEQQRTCTDEVKENFCEENFCQLQVLTEVIGLPPGITEVIGSQSPDTSKKTLLAVVSEQPQIGISITKDNVPEEDVWSLQTGSEAVSAGPMELTASFQNHGDKKGKEILQHFCGDNKELILNKVSKENLHEENVQVSETSTEDTKLLVSKELTACTQGINTAVMSENVMGFSGEQQGLCTNEAKENVCEEKFCRLQVLTEVIGLQSPDTSKKTLLAVVSEQPQTGISITKDNVPEEDVWSLQTGSEAVSAGPMELTASLQNHGDKKGKEILQHFCGDNKELILNKVSKENLHEENVQVSETSTEDTKLLVSKELTACTQGINTAVMSENVMGFSGEQQGLCTNEAKENVCEEKFCRLQVLTEVIGLQSPDTSKKTLLAVVSEQPQTGISITKDNVPEEDVWSLQTGSEAVSAGPMELTASLQNHGDKKGKEILQHFCGDNEELILNNVSKENLHEENVQVSEASTEDTKLLVSKELTACTQGINTAVMSENVMGFSGEQQGICTNEAKENVCEEKFCRLQVLTEVIELQSPDTSKKTLLAVVSEQPQIGISITKDNVPEEDVWSLQTGSEAVSAGPMELTASLQNHGDKKGKEILQHFCGDNEELILNNVSKENLHEENVQVSEASTEDTKLLVSKELTACTQGINTAVMSENVMGFSGEQQGICTNEAKENVCEEKFCRLQVLTEVIGLQSPDTSKKTLLAVVSEQPQIGISITKDNVPEEDVWSLQTGSEAVSAGPMELTASLQNHGDKKGKEILQHFCGDNEELILNNVSKENLHEENVQVSEASTEDTKLLVSKELTACTQGINTAVMSENVMGFSGEQQGICTNEAKENVCEEKFCRLQVLTEVIGLQSPDTSKKTLLAVVSEQPQIGISITKDNVPEEDVWSLQTGSEAVSAGPVELTASLQNHGGKKGKEILQHFCGDNEELILNNVSKENLHEENVQVSEASTEDTKLLVSKELTACTQGINTAVMSENVMGFSGEEQTERVDCLQLGSANNLFPETTKLIPGIQIPDVKDVEKISMFSNVLQQMCSSVIKEEEAHRKTISFLQSAAENITNPESMKLALTPQDFVTSELIAFSNEQPQICSSGMETETCKEDNYIENNFYTDTTMILPFDSSKNDTMEFREKLSDVSWNIEQQNWKREALDNISETNMFKLKADAEITTPLEATKLQSNLQIHELKNGKDYLLASNFNGDKCQTSSGEPEEKVFQEDVNSLKVDRESIIPEATKLTPMPQDPEEVELEGMSLDFEKEQQQTCNTESKEENTILTDSENISAQDPMGLLSSSQKYDTENDEDKFLGFSFDTKQQTCSSETKLSIFKENACIDKMGIENSAFTKSVKLLSSSDVATELQEATNSTLSEAQQISIDEIKENFSVENVHHLETLIPESSGLSCNSLHSDATIQEDILRQRYDSEKQQTLNLSGKESVYVNSVGSMEKGMTFGIDPEMEFPLCTLFVSEAVEINQLLAATSDGVQQQTYDNLISHSTCGEKLSLEMDFALGSGTLPEEMEKELLSTGGMDYKNHAASLETQVSEPMTTESKEPSSTTEHLFLLHIGDASESCLRTGAREQGNITGVLPTGNCAGIDQNSITKQSFVSDIEFGNEFLIAVEPTTKPGCSSSHTLTDVKEEEVLRAVCENAEVRINERGLNEGLKTESHFPESASSSPSAHGKDAMGVICTVTTAALDKDSMTTSASLASEKKRSAPPLLLAPVVPDPPQPSERAKPLDDAEVPRNQLEQIPLSASLASEKKGSAPPLLLAPVVPDPPQPSERAKPLDDAEVPQNHLEQIPLSVSLISELKESVSPQLLALVASHPPPHSEYTKPLDDAEILQNHLEQTPLSVSSPCDRQEDLHPLFAVTPHIVPVEVVQESSEKITKSTSVPCDIKDTGSFALLLDVPPLPKDGVLLQDDVEQSSLSIPVLCDYGEEIDPFLPSVTSSLLQSNGIDEPLFGTAQLLKELHNIVYSDIAESIPPPSPPLCSDTDAVDVEHVSVSVSVTSDCEEPVPALSLPLLLPTLQSDDIDKPAIDITDLQKELVSVSLSSDSEQPIVPPLPSVTPPLSPEGSNEPQVDATDLQELVRSSDSEGAFETPEETTPVKVPPQISPTAAEKESQEHLPSVQSVFFPDDNQIAVGPENSLQETDSFRPLTESASIVFDEDKPIASSGAYKIDFDSLDVLDSFQPHSPLDPSSPVKSEGSKICGQASEKPLHAPSSTSSAPPQSPPFTRKSDGTTDVGRSEDVAKTLQAEAFSIASDNAHGVKKKKPRPLSLKRKTKSEKPAETQAEKPTETPTAAETQARPTVPEANKEVTISQSSCNSLQSAVNQQDSPIPHQASCSFDPDNLSDHNPFASGDKQQTLPVAQSESETVTVVLKESDKIAPESGTLSDPPAVGHAVRLEFDYSEDKDSFETEQDKKPVPKKFGKKSGGKMPLRKPKIGIKKVPTVEKVDNALATPSHSTADPDDIPIPKTTYSFDPSKWDDPNFNPFSSNVQVPNSPKLPHASFSFDMDNCDNSVDPFKSSTKISGSPSHSPASFEVNDDTGTSEGDVNNKSSKKKRLPLKTNTFRVKRSPKRSSLSEASSQESTPLTTPETPQVIGTVEHATDEEKLASSVTNQKWSYSGIQSELEEDKPDYPQPSDLSAFVNENSEFVNENYSSAVLGYEHSLEIEYMEKIGSSSPHHDTNAKKQSMYLKIDSLKDSPIKCPPIRLSDSTTPCSGSSLDDADDGVPSTANKLSVTRPLASSQEVLLQSPDKLKDTDSLNSSPAKSDLATPKEPVASADALLSRILRQSDDELDYLQPDTAEKNPSAFAYKLQEELVYAAMRIEALKLAKQLSNSPTSSLDNEIRGRSTARRQWANFCSYLQQRDSTPSMDTPITKGALYSRTGDSEIDDTQADGHHYNQRDLDSALRTAREEIVAQEREAADWKRKYDESRQEVVEMRRIVAEYEKTIAQMIEDDHREKSISHHTVQQLIMEKDQALSDLNSVEKSLADLFRRYEKMKEVLEGFRKNEEVLKKCAQEYLARVKKEEQRYHALKIHAEEKLDKANAEIAQVRAKSKSEQAAFQASLRKEQMKVESLERTLEQKNKEVEELTKICDELIAKMGKS